jgi:hypothetical protein
MRWVRFRTLGCYPLTGAVESRAATIPEIIQEMLTSRTSERQGRVIDHDQSGLDGEEEAGGLFLMADGDAARTPTSTPEPGPASGQGPAAVHHLRQRG